MDTAAGSLAAWRRAADSLVWSRPYEAVHVPDGRHGRWFDGGRIDVAANCLDRHLPAAAGRVAFHWEGEPGDRRRVTYGELRAEVDAFAAALAELGVGPGDRVALYLGMVPETVVAMLACARLGATHCVLFAALPADALADRLADIDPAVLVTQDGSWRHGVVLPLKARADEALAATAGVEHTVVIRRTGMDVSWFEGDRWYHDLVAAARPGGVPAVGHAADDPLLVVHLADRRGRPAGFVHRAAGLLCYASALHGALTLEGGDVFWCAVDIGWLAGQANGVYGPLAAGATSVLFEGTLDTPTHDRAWELIERYGVNALVTTPSVVRNLRRWTDSPPDSARLASLRLIVTAGEPIDADHHAWLVDEVGRGEAEVRDGWGQTELGGIVTVTGAAGLPDPGLAVFADDGSPVPPGATGELVLTAPWPGMFLGLRSGTPAMTARYWTFPGAYATGDLARPEPDGQIRVLARLDPIVSVSGQLVSVNEVRDVLEEHPFVATAEVVGRPDPRRGQAVVACVLLAAAPGQELDGVADELREHVHDTLGGLATPATVAFLEALPSELSRDELRQALAVLVAAQPRPVLHVSTAQLRAALAASPDT
ncbi:acetate--CoA ligase [soil metagenome]